MSFLLEIVGYVLSVSPNNTDTNYDPKIDRIEAEVLITHYS